MESARRKDSYILEDERRFGLWNKNNFMLQSSLLGVIFSILTNVALYYYGEAKDLKRKVNQGEYLYVRGEDWIEREIRIENEKYEERQKNERNDSTSGDN